MQPTTAVITAMGARIATDTITFNGVQLDLVRNAFTPSPTTTIGELTFADFDGSGPIEAPATGLNAGRDPGTGDITLTAMPPAGGWYWETTGITNLPQTIYGWAMLSNDEATLIAAERFATPIELTGTAQVIELAKAKISIMQSGIL